MLALHHTGHGDGKRMRGSSVFDADADTHVRLDREDKSMLISLSMTKQKDAPEWTEPRFVQLEPVKLAKGVETLVAVAPDPDKRPAQAQPSTKSKNDPTRGFEAVSLVLDAVVAKVLQSNTLKEWSQKKLAEAVALDDAIDIGSDRLRKSYLTQLREAKGTRASRCYDAARGVWRWAA